MSLAAYRRSTAYFASTSHTSAGKLRRPGPQSGALRTLLTPRAAQKQNSPHLSVGMMPSCAAHVQHVSNSVHAYTFKEELAAVQLEGCWGHTAPSRNSWITGSRRHRSLPYGSTDTSSGLRLRPALSPPRRLALTATQRFASAFCRPHGSQRRQGPAAQGAAWRLRLQRPATIEHGTGTHAKCAESLRRCQCRASTVYLLNSTAHDLFLQTVVCDSTVDSSVSEVWGPDGAWLQARSSARQKSACGLFPAAWPVPAKGQRAWFLRAALWPSGWSLEAGTSSAARMTWSTSTGASASAARALHVPSLRIATTRLICATIAMRFYSV